MKMNKDELKKYLKVLKKGTKIYVKDKGEINEAEFIEMRRTRFSAHYRDNVYTFPLSLFVGIKGEESIEYEIKKQKKDNGKMKFIETNNNPFGLRENDCSIRALATTLDITWDKAIIKLAESSGKTGKMINKTETITLSLINNGFVKLKIKKNSMNIKEFINDYAKEYEIYYVLLKGHATAVKGFSLIDTWDCSNEKIESVYKRIC